MKLTVRSRFKAGKLRGLLRTMEALALGRARLRRRDPAHPALAASLPATSMLPKAARLQGEYGASLGEDDGDSLGVKEI